VEIEPHGEESRSVRLFPPWSLFVRKCLTRAFEVTRMLHMFLSCMHLVSSSSVTFKLVHCGDSVAAGKLLA
jgi:hypothetical protein